MTDTLDTVLADAREDAAVLKRAGHAEQAAHLERFIERVAGETEEFRRWLSDADAALHSGLAIRTLRRRFAELLDAGNARYDEKGHRLYRMSALPRRANVAAARERGRRGDVEPQEIAS
jgi:hypothetical protein